MPTHDLDSIIKTLNEHHQRATYGAVARLVDQTPRRLMHDRPRVQGNSWIVSKDTGRPTGYPDADVHPRLAAHPEVLATGDELAAWLEARAAGEKAADHAVEAVS